MEVARRRRFCGWGWQRDVREETTREAAVSCRPDIAAAAVGGVVSGEVG